MRLMKITNSSGSFNVDIDEQTAIGVNYQAYDIKKPGQRIVKVTNQFTIPTTANNMKVFGFAGNPQFTSNLIYEDNYLDYWTNNVQLIRNNRVRVEEISDRISLFCFEKADIWEQIKSFKWLDFETELLQWLQDNYDYYSSTNKSGTFKGIIEPYIDSNEGLYFPFYFGNLYALEPYGEGTGFLEDETNLYLKYRDTDLIGNDQNYKGIAIGGHYCVFVKTIFKFLEYKYNVNFLTIGSGIQGNIWDDIYASNMLTPLRDIDVIYDSGFYFAIRQISETSEIDIDDTAFHPHKDVKANADKTVYDFVNVFFQHFNVIIDIIEQGENDIIALRRFDDIVNYDTLTDWSNRIDSKIISIFKPKIDGYFQNNYIKFKEIYPEGDTLINSKLLECENKGLDVLGDLFEIDSYIPAFIDITNDVVPDLSIKESFKTFLLFIKSDDLTTNLINIHYKDNSDVFIDQEYLQPARLYSLDSEYSLLDLALKKIIFYEANIWLNLKDILGLEYFKQYYIRELNGSYFLNKISGFNPDKSLESVKVELLKISDNTPLSEDYENVFTDGVGNYFTDGVGNYWD